MGIAPFPVSLIRCSSGCACLCGQHMGRTDRHAGLCVGQGPLLTLPEKNLALALRPCHVLHMLGVQVLNHAVCMYLHNDNSVTSSSARDPADDSIAQSPTVEDCDAEVETRWMCPNTRQKLALKLHLAVRSFTQVHVHHSTTDNAWTKGNTH